MAIVSKITNGTFSDTGNIQSNIVPWALPKESIPFRVCWRSGVKVDTIKVVLPEGFEPTDFVNISSSTIEDKIVVLKPREMPSSGMNYFGMAVAYSQIPTELHLSRDIMVDLLSAGVSVWSGAIRCNVFRPLIELKEPPSDIELTDGGTKKQIPLSLKYIGFGEVEIRIEALLGGSIISRGESIVYEVIRRLWEQGFLVEGKHQNRKDEGKKKLKRQVRLNPEYIKKIADDVQEMLRKGGIPSDVLDEKTIEDTKQWLQTLKNSEKFIEILYSNIQEMMLDIMVDLLDRHPAEDITLANSRTKLLANIKAPVEEIDIRIGYRDLMMNEYPPVDVKIKVIDKREKDKGLIVEIPLAIEPIQLEPFKNVSAISEKGGK